MTNLDDKLREMLEIVHEGCKLTRPCPVENQAVRAIKEAFADEGYIQIPSVTEVVDDDKGTHLEVRGVRVMTGQEWYDRFEKEASSNNFDEIASGRMRQVFINLNNAYLEAAKKAAGLK